ncbi:NADPH-dependent FMN reductase [Actinokineospora globicatena]|uniref:FMN reductase n=1 Tax=Actinokineospora globicatena TaxID=103729 RepID=A0A9W6QIX2_9PSEU|nr:NAD(P)H-dependent oxidoreductase [Actinokineospora globicatena]GLW90312.1 FMN reductase [Actinokineospora globicatena]
MSTPDNTRIAVIIGSVRKGRFGPVIANWFTDRVREYGGVDIDLIDLAEHPLPTSLTEPDETTAASAAALAERLGAADGFVLITPEYNHSYPASVKAAIDWTGVPWQAKPVAFVGYGGHGGGARAVEHLRCVFAEVHAVTVREALMLRFPWTLFDEQGQLVRPDAVEANTKDLLDQLTWWAAALREAKATRPYAA